MKKNTHPKYYPQVKVTCQCGNTFTTGATKEAITVEICSACHPFYTGQSKYIDTKGRIEKFQAKVSQVKKWRKQQKEKARLLKRSR